MLTQAQIKLNDYMAKQAQFSANNNKTFFNYYDYNDKGIILLRT